MINKYRQTNATARGAVGRRGEGGGLEGFMNLEILSITELNGSFLLFSKCSEMIYRVLKTQPF